MSHFPPRFLPAALLLAVSCSAYSTSDDALEEVVVTGQKLEESIPLTLREYGNQVDIVLSENILKYDFSDVADTLKTVVPGLHISPKNGPFDYFSASLQGARSKDILWLVDGVRITNRLYNGTSPLDTIPGHMVERVEVLKGGQGIFYGTQSVSGVINIVTKGFSNDFSGAVGVGANTNSAYHVNGFVRGAVSDHQYVVYASKDDADGYQPYDDSDIQTSATDTERGYDVQNVGVKYAWNISDNVRLNAQYQRTNADLDYASPNLNKSTTNARTESIASLKLDAKLSSSFNFFLKAYRHVWDTQYTRIYNELDDEGNLTGGVVIRNMNTYWGYEDYGFNAMAEIDWGASVAVVLGADRQNYSAEDDVWRIADQKETVDAFFGQLRTTDNFLENTRFAFGVRNNRPSKSDSSTVWNFSGKHQWKEIWYAQANIGTSFRLPDAEALFLNEFYDADGDGVADDGWFAVGNPSLEAEESENINISIGANGSKVSFELTGFKRDVKNYIQSYVPIVVNGVEGESFANSDDEVNIEGIELQSKWAFNDALKARWSYTYTRARFNDSGEQLKNIPENESKLGLDYQQPGQPWGFGISAIYVGEVNDRATRDSYVTADLTGFYYFGQRQQHRLTARLENLADVSYATGVGRAKRDATGENYLYRNLGVPRTFHVGYTYQF